MSNFMKLFWIYVRVVAGLFFSFTSYLAFQNGVRISSALLTAGVGFVLFAWATNDMRKRWIKKGKRRDDS